MKYYPPAEKEKTLIEELYDTGKDFLSKHKGLAVGGLTTLVLASGIVLGSVLYRPSKPVQPTQPPKVVERIITPTLIPTIYQTPTPKSRYTPRLTYTTTPSLTPTRTYTPTPTRTATPTPTTTPTPKSTETPMPRILFENDFSEGLDPGWKIIRGDWMILNGWLWSKKADTDPPDSHSTLIVVGDESWTDYRLEFDVKTVNNDDWFSAVVRFQKDYTGTYCGVSGYRGVSGYYYMGCNVWKDGHYLAEANSDIEFLPEPGYGPGSHIVIEAKGDRYTMFLDNQKVLSFTNKGLKNGKIAFVFPSKQQPATIANVKVTSLP